MIWFENKLLHFESDRCCQCGACLSACGHNALSAGSPAQGIFPILWDRVACVNCNLCERICPARELPNRPLTEEEWDSCLHVWVGWSHDPVRRRQASSGGVARTLVEQCLETGECDAAWCVVKSNTGGDARGGLLRRGDDLSNIANSVYQPVMAMAGIPDLPLGTKLLVVGTNCQLQSLDNLYGRRLKLFKVAILCKQQKTLQFSTHLRKLLGVSAGTELEYRGNGWPGSCSAAGLSKPWEQVAALPFGKSLWRLPACRFCPHPLGEGVDITLADPWGIRQERESGGGMNLIIVRTRRGEVMLQASRDALGLETATIEEAKRSVDWPKVQAKQMRIPYYLGTEKYLIRRLYYRLGDWQRRMYEWLLENMRLPLILMRLLGRFPYLG
jgi:coenzyme F420-reducing hydrogenase beta subunit